MDLVNRKNHVIYDDGRIWSKLSGKFIGSLNKRDGYLECSIDGNLQGIHRHIWEAFEGEIPEGFDIHHKNYDRADNRLENLEPRTHCDNCAEQQIRNTNTSGVIGVHFNRNKWQARNRAKHLNGGKLKHIGYFNKKEEAGLARDAYVINNHLNHHTLNYPSCRLEPPPPQ